MQQETFSLVLQSRVKMTLRKEIWREECMCVLRKAGREREKDSVLGKSFADVTFYNLFFFG